MKTTIQFNDSGVPIGITKYADAAEERQLQLNEVELTTGMCTDFEILHRQWRLLSNGLCADVGPAPSKWHDWNKSSNKWDANLTRAKDELWKLAKLIRQKVQYEPLSTPYGLFDGYVGSQRAVADSLAFLKASAERGGVNSITYTLADNTESDLSIAELEDVVFLFGKRAQEIHSKFQTVRRTIEGSSSVGELELLLQELDAADELLTSRS